MQYPSLIICSLYLMIFHHFFYSLSLIFFIWVLFSHAKWAIFFFFFSFFDELFFKSLSWSEFCWNFYLFVFYPKIIIISVRLARLNFANLFYYSAYFWYYSWVSLHFLVLLMCLTVLFQLTFTFIYSTFSKKFSVSAK